MRRKLHQNQTDNLDLLLDTLCDLLGTIVLIACLLVVLIQPEAGSEKTPEAEAASKESGILAERLIKSAQAELDGLQKLRAELQSDDDPSLKPLIVERDALRKTADKLRQERAKQDEMASEKAMTKARDAAQEIARLRAQQQEAEKKLGSASRDLEAARQRKAALEKQMADLALELDNVDTLKIEKLRFPRERRVTKGAKPIIMKFGEVFPLLDGNGNFLDSVRRVPEADDSFTVFPKKLEGMNPLTQAAALRELLRRLGTKGTYLTLYVYPDSYGTLRELKRLIHELGLEYGLEICTEHRVLKFSGSGAAPAPL